MHAVDLTDALHALVVTVTAISLCHKRGRSTHGSHVTSVPRESVRTKMNRLQIDDSMSATAGPTGGPALSHHSGHGSSSLTSPQGSRRSRFAASLRSGFDLVARSMPTSATSSTSATSHASTAARDPSSTAPSSDTSPSITGLGMRATVRAAASSAKAAAQRGLNAARSSAASASSDEAGAGANDNSAPLNSSTLSGATDVIVIQHPNGLRRASPFHVRFGRFKVLRPDPNQPVAVVVNGRAIPFTMRIGRDGVASWCRDESGALVTALSPSASPSPIIPQRTFSASSASSGVSLAEDAPASNPIASTPQVPLVESPPRCESPTRSISSTGSKRQQLKALLTGGRKSSASSRDSSPRRSRSFPPLDHHAAVDVATILGGSIPPRAESPASSRRASAEISPSQLQQPLSSSPTESQEIESVIGSLGSQSLTDVPLSDPESSISIKTTSTSVTASYSIPPVSLTLSPDELVHMPLQWGMNEIHYITRTRRKRPSLHRARSSSSPMPPGAAAHFSSVAAPPAPETDPGDKWDTVTARIWLWPADVDIVISDVDGTISKSDALGLILPTFGVTYAHEGVARLYSSIAANGYVFVYLTSRGIGQAQATREYIASVREAEAHQHLGHQLPDGPVLTSPDGLLTALKREVVTKTPAEFKTATLAMLAGLFDKPDTGSPPASLLGMPLEEDFEGVKRRSKFAAGFGNRETDLVAYASVGIPDSHQFIVDSSGEVAIAARRTRPSSPILAAAAGPVPTPAYVVNSGTAMARGVAAPLAPVSKVPSAVDTARSEREYTTYAALATAAKVNRLFPARAGGREASVTVEMQSIALAGTSRLDRHSPTEEDGSLSFKARVPEPYLGAGPGAGSISLSESAGAGAAVSGILHG